MTADAKSQETRSFRMPLISKEQFVLAYQYCGSIDSHSDLFAVRNKLYVDVALVPETLRPLSDEEKQLFNSDSWFVTGKRNFRRKRQQKGPIPVRRGPSWQEVVREKALKVLTGWKDPLQKKDEIFEENTQDRFLQSPGWNTVPLETDKSVKVQSVRTDETLKASGKRFDVNFHDSDFTEPSRSEWWYKDYKGIEHGPFSPEDMKAWYAMDYLPLNLLVKSDSFEEFAPLVDLFAAGDRAFLDYVPMLQQEDGIVEEKKFNETVSHVTEQMANVRIEVESRPVKVQTQESSQKTPQEIETTPLVPKQEDPPFALEDDPDAVKDISTGSKPLNPWNKVKSVKIVKKKKVKPIVFQEPPESPEEPLTVEEMFPELPETVPQRPKLKISHYMSQSITQPSAWAKPSPVAVQPIVPAPLVASQSNTKKPLGWTQIVESKPSGSLEDIIREEAERRKHLEKESGIRTETMASRVASGWSSTTAKTSSLASIMKQQERLPQPLPRASGWSAVAVKQLPHESFPSLGAVDVDKEDSMFWESAAPVDIPVKSSTASVTTFGSPKLSPQFAKWCQQELEHLVGNRDLTLVEFLLTLESDDAVRQHIREYLGNSAPVDRFATSFLSQRAFERKEVSKGSSHSNASNALKKKKKKKKQIPLDGRPLFE